MKKKYYNEVLKHLKEDMSESRESIREDKMLAKKTKKAGRDEKSNAKSKASKKR